MQSELYPHLCNTLFAALLVTFSDSLRDQKVVSPRIGRITGFRLLPIKSILAVRDARLLVQSHAKEQYGGTPWGLW